MKTTKFLKILKNNGWYFKREGGNHTIYTDGKRTTSVPRHPEMNERLARDLIKKLGLK